MTDDPKFDPARSAAIRTMLTEVAGEDAAGKPARHRLGRRGILILVAAIIVGVAGTAGGAYAINGGTLIYTPSATPGGGSHLGAVPHWKRNANGQTYGVQGNSPIPPDLIKAQTTTGLTGYIYSAALQAAEGPMPTSPAQAATWNKTHPPKTVYIPVYKSDGVTQIGVFQDGG